MAWDKGQVGEWGAARGSATSDLFHGPPRDPQFSATPVLASDVIHAQSKDLPRIFRVSAWGRMGQTTIYCHADPLSVTFLHPMADLFIPPRSSPHGCLH